MCIYKRRKAILLVVVSIAIGAIVVANVVAVGSAPSISADTGPKQIAVFMKNKRSESTRHIYSDLRKGLARQRVSSKISVLTHKELKVQLFSDYDILVVVSEGKTDILAPNITSFVQKHADKQQLITVALLPYGKKTLSRPPQGVDIISSASREDQAKDLVIRVVAPEIKKRLAAIQTLQEEESKQNTQG